MAGCGRTWPGGYPVVLALTPLVSAQRLFAGFRRAAAITLLPPCIIPATWSAPGGRVYRSTIAHPTVPARMPAAWLDPIQQGDNPNWSCPLTPWDLRPDMGGEKVFPEAGHE